MIDKKLLVPFNLTQHKTKQLDGYDSLNYLILSNPKAVLKHYQNSSELELIHAECDIIRHLSGELNVDLPVLMGEIQVYEDNTFGRLIPYLEGEFLKEVQLSESLLINFGKQSGRLISALQGIISTPIQARKSEWDLQYLDLNEHKLKFIDSPIDKKIVLYFLDQWKHHVKETQKDLRQSILHGDLNENNVLASNQEITGFIDFGDICHGPIINEVGIALSYIAMLRKEDPENACMTFLKGFHSEFKLEERDLEVLYYLIPGRLCCSVLNSAEKASKGDNRDYISQNESGSWQMLRHWLTLNPILFENMCRSTLGFTKKNISTQNELDARKRNFSSAMSLSYSEPIHMEKAAFQYMYDVDGNTFLDAYNNIPHVGHSHPEISETASKAMRKLNTNTRYVFDELQSYSDHLLSYFPHSISKLFLVNSGSAAGDLAIRIAMNHTQSDHIAVMEHGYHGNTRLTINASSYKFNGKGGTGNPEKTLVLPLPKEFNGSKKSGREYANEAISILKNEIQQGRKPACLIAEPISGCGGQVPLAYNYLNELVPFLKEENILYISDEVQTGFGRLGSHFWGFEMHNVEPDIVVMGKPMGNGHPIAGVACKKELSESFDNGMEFFSSFGGNPVSCSIGKMVLEIIEKEQLQKNALETGIYWKEKLIKLQNDFPFIADVRGEGLFLGIELYQESDHGFAIAQDIKNEMRKRHILISTDGPHDNVLKMKPPMCFNKDNVDEMIKNLKEVLYSSQYLN